MQLSQISQTDTQTKTKDGQTESIDHENGKVHVEYSDHFLSRLQETKRMIDQKGQQIKPDVVKTHMRKSIDYIMNHPELHPTKLQGMKKVAIVGKYTHNKIVIHIHPNKKIHVATFLNHDQDISDFEKEYTRNGKRQTPGSVHVIESILYKLISEKVFENQLVTIELDL